MTKYLTRALAALAALTTLGALLVVLSPPAAALYGAPDPTFSMAPTYGPAGTVITLSGKCNFIWDYGGYGPATQGTDATKIYVALVQGNDFIAYDIEPLPNTYDESWTATMTVPAGAAIGQDTVGAACLRSDNTSSGDAPFSQRGFTVTDPIASHLSMSPITVVDATRTTVTASLTGALGPPIGTVTFHASNGEGSVFNATGSGPPVFILTSGAPATIHVTAHYSGSPRYLPADAAIDVKFVRATTVTTATMAPANPVPYGQPVTISGTVKFTNVPDPTHHPNGNVVIVHGGVVIAEAGAYNGKLTASGPDEDSFSVVLPQEAVGSTPLSVQFRPGNPLIEVASSTNVGPLIVAPSTSTALEPSANPAVPGQAVRFTSTVTAIAPATGTPTGSVAFAVDGSWIGVAPLDANGQATSPPVSNLTKGQHLIAAVYFGDGAALSPSVGYAIQVVAPRTAHLSATSVLASYPTLHATLTAGGAPLAGRTVTFTTPTGSVLCTATTAADGSATCGQWTKAFLAFGYHVAFAGDAADTPATVSVGW